MNGIQIDVSVPSDPWMIALWVALVVFFVLPIGAVLTAVGFWMLAKIAPIRFILFGWATILAAPLRRYLGDIVREETQEIRDQVFPNGGSSMNDRLRQVLFEVQEWGHRDTRVQQDFGAFEAVLLDLRAHVENLSEVPAKVDQLEQRLHEMSDERRE